MVPFPGLDNDELREYCSRHPISGALAANEIVRELSHWHTLCSDRLHEEVRTARGNPLSIANVYRLGGGAIALLGFPAAFAGPIVGISVAVAGLGLYIYGEIKDLREKRRRESIRLALERCKALDLELRNRCVARAKNASLAS